MCLCCAVRRLLVDVEPIPTHYGPSVFRCYMHGRKFILTLVHAESPSCSVAPVGDPSKATRFHTLEEFANFFNIDIESAYFEARRQETSLSSSDTE